MLHFPEIKSNYVLAIEVNVRDARELLLELYSVGYRWGGYSWSYADGNLDNIEDMVRRGYLICVDPVYRWLSYVHKPFAASRPVPRYNKHPDFGDVTYPGYTIVRYEDLVKEDVL